MLYAHTTEVVPNEIDGNLDRVELLVLRYKKLQLRKKVRAIYFKTVLFYKRYQVPGNNYKDFSTLHKFVQLPTMFFCLFFIMGSIC
jgi:hypothetical protein